jgi:hypothetical protein
MKDMRPLIHSEFVEKISTRVEIHAIYAGNFQATRKLLWYVLVVQRPGSRGGLQAQTFKTLAGARRAAERVKIIKQL